MMTVQGKNMARALEAIGSNMNDLLKLAVETHGGLDRWNRFATLTATASITGALWQFKGTGDLLTRVSVEALLHEQRVTTRLVGRDKRLLFTPQRVASETEDGRLLEARFDPRAAFRGHRQESAWDDLHVAYFSSYALWTYLTIPFLYTYPGFVTEELPPWREDGETWRPLKVTFPESVASHTREQVSYFGEDGLLRRHEYTVDVMDGARGVNYASASRDVDGILVPTKRRVYAYDDRKNKIPEPLLVAIDFSDIAFAER
jgi:hypothetical protein